MALIASLYRDIDGFSPLSEALNFDFATKGLDELFTDEELKGMSGIQAMRDRVMKVIGRNPTVRDFLNVTRRGRPREAIVGNPKQLADRLEKWFVERACDGVVLGATHVPGTFEECKVRRAGTAAARSFSEGLQGHDTEGESRPAAASPWGVASGGGIAGTATAIARPRSIAARLTHVIRSVGARSGHIRSKIAAMPWPPPMHMVTSAYWPPMRCSS
jgi:hypothetical protein